MSYAPTGRQAENTGFACIHCGAQITKHPGGSYRNHCPRCLWSKHVDVLPGDRAADCGGAMEPVGVDHSGKKGYILLHRCTVCQAQDRNRLAPDDDMDAVIALQRPVL
ncbi:RNHCP domain-containing protein [Nesterenkonia alkaliphila]|uniref:RNHCP domain-containing protein n=1 Tax=Nesterenkonia alkaliphila TaxID=1463631 RepID=A0A7K1UFR6_9MICC|nr:RNHCP domain-containing protein [Nesterenkonia alkaliphila]MVT25307.1 RNHCP domain-containing protein [Nesterenkonia alkaliphila]GFZ81973.1 RNHCP domain-containing protein [Nesterenkonia alkaliphila]